MGWPIFNKYVCVCVCTVQDCAIYFKKGSCVSNICVKSVCAVTGFEVTVPHEWLLSGVVLDTHNHPVLQQRL